MFLSRIINNELKYQQPNKKVYETHKLIWSLFPFEPGFKDRKFIYFLFEGQIFMASKVEPTLLPEHQFKMDTKPYDRDLIKNGMLFKFDIRLHPQVCRESVKMSAMTAYANDLREKNQTYSLNQIAHKSSERWFKKRVNNLGFDVLDHRVVSFHHNRFRRSDKVLVCYNSIDLNGLLQVTHKGLFLKSLYEGIGRSKGFGCGMLLIAPYTEG